jgi:hypothetical protein
VLLADLWCNTLEIEVPGIVPALHAQPDPAYVNVDRSFDAENSEWSLSSAEAATASSGAAASPHTQTGGEVHGQPEQPYEVNQPMLRRSQRERRAPEDVYRRFLPEFAVMAIDYEPFRHLTDDPQTLDEVPYVLMLTYGSVASMTSSRVCLRRTRMMWSQFVGTGRTGWTGRPRD